MIPTPSIKGFKKWALILALCFMLQKATLRAQWTPGHSYGPGATAPGYASTSFGIVTTSSGAASTALGNSSTAVGDNSLVFGETCSAYGESSLAFGCATSTIGRYSAAFGLFSTASADIAFAGGFSTTASGYCSTSLGGCTTASGIYSTASGYATAATSYASFVIGQYNVGGVDPNPTSWVATDPVFEIGNGYLNPSTYTPVLSDAFVVYKNGNAMLSGTLSISGSSNAVLVNPVGDLSMGPFTNGPQPQ